MVYMPVLEHMRINIMLKLEHASVIKIKHYL